MGLEVCLGRVFYKDVAPLALDFSLEYLLPVNRGKSFDNTSQKPKVAS